jgi:hypothetical protein
MNIARNRAMEEWNIGKRKQWKNGILEDWVSNPIVPPFHHSNIFHFVCSVVCIG